MESISSTNTSNSEASIVSPPTIPAATSDQLPDDVIRYLVTMGTWAPSADNCQPWKFEWDGKTLFLIKDPERTGYFYDVNQEATLLTFGAVIQNLRIAASHYGLDAVIDYLPNGVDDQLVATMQFRYAQAKKDDLFAHLLTRRVNRNAYDDRKIPAELVGKLLGVNMTDPLVRINLIDRDEEKKKIQNLIHQADVLMFEDQRLIGSLFKWIRPKVEVDGMSIDTLGLGAMQKKIFPLFSHWPLLNFLNKFGMSKVMSSASVQLLKGSPTYCLITLTNRDPVSFIKGGEVLQRFWLTASSLGLSVQPMMALPFILNHYAHDEGAQFKQKHQDMMRDMSNAYRSIVNAESSTLLFFLRIGFGKPQAMFNSRRGLDQVFSTR
jgi:nitroreductase